MAQPSLLRRTLLPVVGGMVFLVALAGVLWLIAGRISNNSESLDVRLGDNVFDLGSAEARAESIATDGAPFFFQDLLTDGTRDIYVNHDGIDALKGWVAFAARVPGSPRRCTLTFPRGGTQFTDPCTTKVWPANGAGLPQFPVAVTSGGRLQVDLTPAGEPGRGTTTSTSSTG